MTAMTTRTLLWLLAVAPLLACLALAVLITFGVARPPPPMPAVDGVAVAAARSQPMAPLQTFAAREGTRLAYRAYLPAAAAAPARVAILIHGSGGSSANMNILGRALAAQGVPAFAPDERGHGESGRRGDVDHIGQLEDDLADLVALVHKTYPTARLVLGGHSSGGGFALRVAGEPEGRLFERFVLLGGALCRADRRPRDPEPPGGPRARRAADPGLRRRARPAGAHLVLSADDEFRAQPGDQPLGPGRLSPRRRRRGRPVPVRVIPDIGHMDLISDPRAVPEVVQAIAR
jgi:hypothetical protein